MMEATPMKDDRIGWTRITVHGSITPRPFISEATLGRLAMARMQVQIGHGLFGEAIAGWLGGRRGSARWTRSGRRWMGWWKHEGHQNCSSQSTTGWVFWGAWSVAYSCLNPKVYNRKNGFQISSIKLWVVSALICYFICFHALQIIFFTPRPHKWIQIF